MPMEGVLERGLKVCVFEGGDATGIKRRPKYNFNTFQFRFPHLLH